MPDYARLRTELLDDPLTASSAVGWNTGSGYLRPYSQLTDAEAAQKLNALDTGRQQRRADITPAELLEAIDVRDFVSNPGQVNNAALASAWFESITQAPTVRLLNEDGTATRARANLNRLLADTNGSQSRFTALAVRTVSRQQELNLGLILEADVKTARSGVW